MYICFDLHVLFIIFIIINLHIYNVWCRCGNVAVVLVGSFFGIKSFRRHGPNPGDLPNSDGSEDSAQVIIGAGWTAPGADGLGQRPGS